MYARFSDHEREKPAGKLPNCGGGEMNKIPFQLIPHRQSRHLVHGLECQAELN